MSKDQIFEYLKNICGRNDIIQEYEKLYKDELQILTTQVNSELDFLIIFTMSIFNQTGTSGLLQSKDIRNKCMDGKLNKKDGRVGENHPKNKGKLLQIVTSWIRKDKTEKTLDNFANEISNWLENRNKENKASKRCITSILEFKEFLKGVNESKLKSYCKFRDEMIRKKFIKIKDSNEIEVTRKLPQMGEKTFGLFIEYLAFYTREKRGYEVWKKEANEFPIYGFNETYIRTFLKDVYRHYAKILQEERGELGSNLYILHIYRASPMKKLQRFLIKKTSEILDFVGCQVVNIAIVSSLTKLERGSIEITSH